MTSEDECIQALQEATEILGESPSKAQYEELGLTPASATIIRVVGGWNDAKEVAGLSTNPSRGSRTQPKPDHVDLPDGYEWEELSVDQRWHYRHPDENTQRSLDRRAELRKMLHRYKAESDGCTRCGETDPACLDFHHRDGTDKEMDVNKMVPYGYSRTDIQDEVDKCYLLCANCHWREHHGSFGVTEEETESTCATLLDRFDRIDLGREELLEGKPPSFTKEERQRTWTYAYQRAQGCRQCGEQDPICLQFHHVAEKTMGVGEMIAKSYPTEQVVEEVQQCEVLCANCHRKAHYDNPVTEGGESDSI